MNDELTPRDGSDGGRLEITEADLDAMPATAPISPAMPQAAGAPAAGGEPGSQGEGFTEATRLMCAAAYLDGTFAQDVVEEIIHERHRAVQIPTGVDIALVARHCLAALRQKLVRDVLLAADVVATLVLLSVKSTSLWLLLGFLFAWAVVCWDIWSATYLVVVRRLSPKQFATNPPPPIADPHIAARIDELARDQRGNLTVYSGFLPFSGAGIDVGGWSFLIDLRKGKQDLYGDRKPAQELSAASLYETTGRSLTALGMPNLEIRDRLFVSGSDVRDDRTLMSDILGPPNSWVGTDVLGRYMASPTHRVRHYRCIEIVDWRGELVVTLFLRFSISNGRLFCELNKFVLVPLKEELHRLNHLGTQMRLGDLISMASHAALKTPGLSLRSIAIVIRPIRRGLRQSRTAKHVATDEFFDYGAPVTALDRVRSTRYRRYFQRLDKEMYDKFLERTVLDAIVETLDRHGIDTAEITERTTEIINNGIMMKDSTLQAGNLATGGSRIQVNFKLPRGGGGEGASAPGPLRAAK